MSQQGIFATGLGPLPPASPPGFGQVYNTGAQNIANGATITFDSNGPLFNIAHVLGSDTITVNSTGTYMITWIVSAQGDGGGYTLLQNGVAVPTLSFVTDPGNGESVGNGIVNISSGDTIQLRNNTRLLIALETQAGFANASITFEKIPAGGASSGTNTLAGNVGSATQVAGIINVVTANSTFITSGAGNTLTLDFFKVNSNIGSSLPAITTGIRNTGYGAGVNQSLTTGTDNTTVGYGAFVNATTAIQNIAIGTQALNANVVADDNVAIGFQALTLATGGFENIAIGTRSMASLTTGDSNTAVGYLSLLNNSVGSDNVAIGSGALGNATNDLNIALGFQAGINATTNTSCIYIGNAGVAAENNIIRIGTDGNAAGQQNTTVIAGDVASVRSFTATAGNITASLGDVVITSGNLEIATATAAGGAKGLISYTGAGDANRFISARGTQNFFAGFQSGNTSLTVGSAIGNTGVGFQALEALTTGAANTALGQSAGTAITSGNRNTAIGLDALELLTTGSDNIALGQGAGSAYTTESGNIAIGLAGVALDASVTRIANIYGTTVGATNAVVVIDNTGKLGTAGGGVDFIATITGNTGGAESPSAGNFNILTANSTVKFAGTAATETLNFAGDVNLNINFGSSMPALTTGAANLGMGSQALKATTSGSSNIAIGESTLQALTTASNNIGIGTTSLNACNASGNIALGNNVLNGILSGVTNIGIGHGAGNSLGVGSESNNIYINHGGVSGESNVMRLGITGAGAQQVNKCFIAGIDGVNVGSVAKVVTMASDQLGTATIQAGSSVTVTPGANTITIAATTNIAPAYNVANVSPFVVNAATMYYITVDTSTIPITIQLPNAPTTRQMFVIKDSAGNASVNNITVTTVGGVDLIDGFTTFTMNTNYQAIQVIWSGVGYEIF